VSVTIFWFRENRAPSWGFWSVPVGVFLGGGSEILAGLAKRSQGFLWSVKCVSAPPLDSSCRGAVFFGFLGGVLAVGFDEAREDPGLRDLPFVFSGLSICPPDGVDFPFYWVNHVILFLSGGHL